MKKNLLKISLSIILCIMVVAFVAGHSEAKDVKVKKLEIVKGKKHILKYKKKKSYKSTNKKVASVSKKGVIKAKKCGKCVIKVMLEKKVIAKYKVKVVKSKLPEKTPTPTPVPTEQPVASATPEPTPTIVGGKVFCIGRCIVSSSKKINETEYETIVDLDEAATKWLAVCYPECSNAKHMIIKTDETYDVNKMLDIVVTRGESTYKIIDAETVEITNDMLVK